MTTTSRRAVLAGAASLPAIAAVAFPAAASGDDARLFQLERRLRIAQDHVKKACAVADAASERYEALAPPEPETAKPPAEYAELYKRVTVGQLEVMAADHPLKVWCENTELYPASVFDPYRAECRRLKEECGVDDAEWHMERAFDVRWKIGEAILKTPAKTPAGMVVKINAVEALEMDFDRGPWDSLTADIRALAVRA